VNAHPPLGGERIMTEMRITFTYQIENVSVDFNSAMGDMIERVACRDTNVEIETAVSITLTADVMAHGGNETVMTHLRRHPCKAHELLKDVLKTLP